VRILHTFPPVKNSVAPRYRLARRDIPAEGRRFRGTEILLEAEGVRVAVDGKIAIARMLLDAEPGRTARIDWIPQTPKTVCSIFLTCSRYSETTRLP